MSQAPQNGEDAPTERIRAALETAISRARAEAGGEPAGYIPELAQVDPERTSAAVTCLDGSKVTAGDAEVHRFTLQSCAKIILLAGLLEELGDDEVFATVGTEPSGASFASVARLETHGPLPANPLVNSGAIALCSRIPGGLAQRLAWLSGWVERLCGRPLSVNQRVLESERRTADRNRAIAFFLKGSGVLRGEVEDTLSTYFTLCSFEAGVAEVSHLAAVLAGGGRRPGAGPDEEPVIDSGNAARVVALMATCGMYDESGSHLLRTGLPAKSGVSGVIAAVALGRAGLAVSSPRVNAKGGSVRGHRILEDASRELGWHFALGSEVG